MHIIALIFALLTGTLSGWQVYRLGVKNEMITQMKSFYELPHLHSTNDLREFRRAQFQGKWLDDLLFLSYKIKKGEIGCEVIKPFRLNAGETFLVNIGWQKSCKVLEKPLPETVIGILREFLTFPQGTSPNFPGEEWHYMNALEMKSAFKEKFHDRFYIDVEKNLPQLPNNHLMYALTWGCLSLIFFFIFVGFFRKR
jgi:surfeit locus 1 family protein